MGRLGFLSRYSYSWAFPRGDHHQLIYAAIGKDDTQGFEAANAWLSNHDLDDATFREQRLLLRVIGRFGKSLQHHSAYPRLVGMQRQLWTRSRMAIQEARPSLLNITQAGIPILLIKGASRLASQQEENKRRVAWDIDIVVASHHMLAAFDILVRNQWHASPGNSPQYIRKHLDSMRSINLFRGVFGDIDLHRQIFHPGQGGETEESETWQSSVAVTLADVPVLVPQPEDQIAIAIGHGGLDGHTHSDWMVDCAVLIQENNIDWSRLSEIVKSRSITVPAAVLFHYFRDQLQIDIPGLFIDDLAVRATSNPIALGIGMVQSRPKERAKFLGAVVRGLAKRYRKRAALKVLKKRSPDQILRVRRIRTVSLPESEPQNGETFVQSWTLPGVHNTAQTFDFSVDLAIDATCIAPHRRIEWEINSSTEHLCRARFRYRGISDSRELLLRISGTVSKPTSLTELTLEARPSRQLRSYANAEELARYNFVPFKVLAFRCGCS